MISLGSSRTVLGDLKLASITQLLYSIHCLSVHRTVDELMHRAEKYTRIIELYLLLLLSSHLFWTSDYTFRFIYVDAPANVIQEEGHTTRFFVHPLSAVLALIFYDENDSAVPFPRRS